MKKITTLILLIIASVSYGQTKKETQDWIKEKIELYSYSDERSVFNNYVIEYSEEYLIVKNTNKIVLENYESSLKSTIWIPIKELTKIRFEEKSDNVWLFLKLKSGKRLIKSKYNGESKTEYLNETEILLEKSINENDLRNRLSTAFNHLIKLYGGTIAEEKF